MKKVIMAAMAMTLGMGLMTGCGDDPKIEAFQEESTRQPGIFTDSPVDGLTVKANGTETLTANGGNFYYEKGDQVVVQFYVGSIYLGSRINPVQVMPSDFMRSNGLSRAAVVNQLRFIQALDMNNNLDDGIQLYRSARVLTGQTVNWDDITSVENALRNISIDEGLGSNGLQLVDEATAIQHFEDYNHVTL